jgi:hypothetical protein
MPANYSVNRTQIPLRGLRAGYLGRWAPGAGFVSTTKIDVALARSVLGCNACFESLSVERAGIGMPQPFSVGKRYRQGGVAFFGINPGAGSGSAYKEARFRALSQFASGDDTALTSYWEALAKDADTLWNKKYLARIRSLGLQLDQLLVGNLAVCATAGNKYPKAMLRNCWSRHVERMLKHYSPGTLVLMGAEETVGEFLRKAQSVLPSMHTVRIAHYAHREGKAYEVSECARVRKLLGT